MNNQSQQTDPIIAEHLLPARVAFTKRKFGNTNHQLENDAVETYYYATLHKIKTLLKEDDSSVFKKLYSQINNQNAFSMHAYVSSNFYLYMECDDDYKYKIAFCFINCKHEQSIRELLNDNALRDRTREVAFNPDFSLFFLEAMAYKQSTMV